MAEKCSSSKAAKEAPAQIVNINIINSNCTTNAAVINQGDQATTQVSDSHMNMGGTHVTNEQDSKAVEVALAPKTIKQKNTFPLELQTILKMAAEQALSLRDSENQNNDQEAGQIEEVDQGTAGPVSTPPRNVNTENHRVQENVRKFENTTRRMRNGSESDHSEPVSLPIVAFSRSTGQIDGRYSPENSKNYSNPILSSSLESDDECRKYGFTETDLVANRQSIPDSENQNNDQEVGQIEEDNQGTAGPVSTSPRNVITENHRVQENVKNLKNTTRRMRSVSESDHSEPVSLPIVAFTKSTGQIDGRYSPENSKNYSNPKLSSFLESDDECRIHFLTETDLVANHQPRPSEPLLKDFENQNNSRDDEQIEEDNQGTVDPLLTTPETPSEYSGCCSGIYKSVCDFLNPVKLYFCDHPMFSKLDFLLTLVSIGLFLFDVLSDLALAATYYTKIEDNEIYRVYFGLTLCFVIIPSVITQIYSFFREDAGIYFSKSKRLVFFVIHFFQLSVLYRYFRVIYCGVKSRYYERVNNKEYRIKFHDKYGVAVAFTGIIRLLESFMESAPQLVLQIYIVLMTKQFLLITVISCAGSLLSLSTTMVSTQRYFRAGGKTQLSILASIVIFYWRACTILSRVVIFGMFLTVQPYVFLVCMILHWVVATVLLKKVKTGNRTGDFLRMVSIGILYGFVYIFCYIGIPADKDIMKIKPRLRMFIFYAVVVIENVVFSCWCYLTQFRSQTGMPFGNLSSTSSNETFTGLPFETLSSTSSNETTVENELFPTESAGIFESQHAFIILVAVNGLFLLGMFFMLVYYQVLHPNKSLPTCCKNLSCRKQWHNTCPCPD